MKFLIAAVLLSAAVTACADRSDPIRNTPAPSHTPPGCEAHGNVPSSC